MRVTCVSNSLDAGGAEKNFVWLAEKLKKAGHDVTFLTLRHDVPDFHRLSTSITRLHAAPAVSQVCRWYGWRCHAKRLRALKNDILLTEPTVVVSFIDTTNISVLMALSSTGIPVIVSERVDARYYDIGYRWKVLRRMYYPRAAKVVVQTKAVKDWAVSVWPRWSVEAIPNPVLPMVEQSPCDAARPKWFKERNIVAAGRFVHQKGFDLLLEAFAPLAKQYPEWDLTILGDGPLKTMLEELAQARKIESRVHFPGVIKGAVNILRESDLFVLSSRFEGFPNALCEAMACGLPVISFDCPSGPAEIVDHERNGILVPPENVRELRNSMRRLMADGQERQRLAKRAREIVKRYSEEEVLGWWQILIKAAAKPGIGVD